MTPHGKKFICLTILFSTLAAFENRSTAQELSYAVLGDAGEWEPSTLEVQGSVERAGVSRLVLPGDNVYTANNYATPWSPWIEHGFTFDVVAIGNHNLGYQREMDFFGMPGEYYAVTPTPSVRFLVLNSDNNGSARKQAKWLDKQLTQATESLIFVVFHHPSFSLTDGHRWQENRSFHEAVRPVLFEHRSKLTALLVGHDHLAGLYAFDDLPVILSGAVHEQRKPERMDNTQEGVRVRTDWIFDRAPYWVKLELNTDLGLAIARFIRGKDDRESCTALIFSGAPATLLENCQQ